MTSPRLAPPWLLLLPLLTTLLLGCASGPPPPDWQMNAKAALERATEAYLSGNSRVATAEFARARAELARTGRADLLARAELTRCAAQVASLEFDDCPAFAALAQDAAPAERAYARYLAGRAEAGDLALLPAAQRAPATAEGGTALARLVAAGVQLRSGRADPGLYGLAVATASAQGWRRPLLAWLQLQLQRAEAAQDAESAAALRRRIALVLGPPAP